MALEGVDQEILQDFLVEAGELIENLSEQLVALEKNPEDSELLNAIFRAFHTVKGGAGFLNLTPLVEACHGAENVFDCLRKKTVPVTSDLMDVIFQAYDTINEMFHQVQNGEMPEEAPEALLNGLKALCTPGAVPSPAPKPVAPPPPPPPPPPKPAAAPASVAGIDTISDDEFEALLDSLHGKGVAPGSANDKNVASEAGSDIESEFDAILAGAEAKPVPIPGAGSAVTPAPEPPKPAPAPADPVKDVFSSPGDTMTDDDFEALLDSLHGKGVAPGSANDKAARPAAPATPEPSKPAPSGPSSATDTAKSSVTSKAPSSDPAASGDALAGGDHHPDKAAAAKVTVDDTVRVETKILDNLMNMVGELVLVRNRLLSIGSSMQSNEELNKTISNLDVVTADLQGAVMKTRMQPIKKVFGRFPQLIRKLARNLGKKIELVMEGEETDLDKTLVDALADPMIHLVRNSCDHGIEMPDVRARAGKPEQGTVTLSASQEGDHILLKIIDDGAGMDPQKLKSVAIKRGVLDKETAERMTDVEAFNLIFKPGFSTKENISDISGRGVGMDVVKTNITKLNGSLRIDSKLGKGTIIEIKVPLTLAILPTLMVKVGSQSFALPLTSVNEIFHLRLDGVKKVDGQDTIVIREKAIPLFYLQDWLIRNHSQGFMHPEWGHVVLVQQGNGNQVAFVVDELVGQEEVVIKPLDQLLHGTPGMAGATITSDGGIALILDIPSLLRGYAKKDISKSAVRRPARREAAATASPPVV